MRADAGFLQMAHLGLVDELLTHRLERHLDGFIAVMLGRLLLDDGAGAREHYGDGDHGAVLAEHLGHAHLGS